MATHDDDSEAGSESVPSTRWWGEGQEGVAAGRRGDQVRALVDAFAAQGIPIGVFPSDDRPQDMEYMYRKQVVLTRDVDAERVHLALGLEPTWDKRVGRDLSRDRLPASVSGLTLVSLPLQDEQGAGQDTPYWFDRLDRALGVGVAVPDHVVHITPGGACPATEPLPSAGMPQPGINPDPVTDGRQVKVVVVDTGVLPDVVAEHAWLTGVTGQAEPLSVGHYRGHGTFVAGVVRTMAPATTVDVKAILVIGGGILESDLAVALQHALSGTPDIISMSAGTTTRAGLALLALENFWLQHLSKLKGTVLVAAAGNDGNRGPFWPAAFPWSVSVGALDVDGARAGYSNHGSWVDVYARGSDLVNAYPRGPYQYQEPPLAPSETSFVVGMASWSGTSFSTPLVSGLIAARMTWSGESAREAASALLRSGRENARLGVGAVLEPGDASPA